MPDVIAPQVEFKTLEDFIKGSNNFFLFFLEDNLFGKEYREEAVFKRFYKSHGEMEKEVTRKTIEAMRARPLQRLPYEQLWEAYKIMSQLIFVNDEYVMNHSADGETDKYYLTR